MLIIDDSGDRKDGVKTAHVGHQWLGRYGQTGNRVATVTTVWADERLYYPVHAVPYTPARHFAKEVNAARALAWHGPDDPGDWQPVTHVFRDGHAGTWYAADAAPGWWGRRHQALVNAAFSFCWQSGFRDHPAPASRRHHRAQYPATDGARSVRHDSPLRAPPCAEF